MTNLIRPQAAQSLSSTNPPHTIIVIPPWQTKPNQKAKASSNQGELRPADV